MEQSPFLARGAWTWVQPLQDHQGTAQSGQGPNPVSFSFPALVNWVSHWRSESEPGEEIKQATSLAHSYQLHL